MLDAATGESLTATGPLSRSDAFLNIQSDGVESLGAGVKKVQSADGSFTYYVDLHNLHAAGVASAFLSFDLIGFGAGNSQVTLRAVRVVRDPLALDDALVLDEDTALALAPLANDPVGSEGMPVFELVQGPVNGELTIGADGGMVYRAAVNYHGADSFSYRYTVDGRTSNVATVQLTVRAVNDAATAPDGQGTIMAGQPFSFDPVAHAVDIEGDALSVVVLAGPAARHTDTEG